MDKQVSLPPSGSISGKSSLCGSPRGFGASTALASTTDQNDRSSHITAQSSTGRASDLRKVRVGFGKAPQLSLLEVPSIATRRGGSTVRDRPPAIGAGHFGTNHSSLPKVQIPSSTKMAGASLLDLSSTDLRSSKVSGAYGRHQRQRETVM